MRVQNPAVGFDAGSFRDPDTRVFHHDGSVYRCLSTRALADWRQLAGTGFYARFVADRRVISTRGVTDPGALPQMP